MVELGKRRRVIITDSDDEDADFESSNMSSTTREIAIPSKNLDDPLRTFPDTPPKDAKFWVESTFSDNIT